MHDSGKDHRRNRAVADCSGEPDRAHPQCQLRRNQHQRQAENCRRAGRQRHHVRQREKQHRRPETAVAKTVQQFADRDPLPRARREEPQDRGEACVSANVFESHGGGDAAKLRQREDGRRSQTPKDQARAGRLVKVYVNQSGRSTEKFHHCDKAILIHAAYGISHGRSDAIRSSRPADRPVPAERSAASQCHGKRRRRHGADRHRRPRDLRQSRLRGDARLRTVRDASASKSKHIVHPDFAQSAREQSQRPACRADRKLSRRAKVSAQGRRTDLGAESASRCFEANGPASRSTSSSRSATSTARSAPRRRWPRARAAGTAALDGAGQGVWDHDLRSRRRLLFAHVEDHARLRPRRGGQRRPGNLARRASTPTIASAS